MGLFNWGGATLFIRSITEGPNLSYKCSYFRKFPETVSRNIFLEISRKVQFEKKSKRFTLRNFCLKRMRVLTVRYNGPHERVQGTKQPSRAHILRVFVNLVP
eukprot:UN25430